MADFLPPTPSRSDHELAAVVRAARTGDDDAWARLIARFDRGLRRIARSYRLSPADVDDAVQAAWVRLFQHIGRLRDPGAVAGWLATTTRRESMRLCQAPVRERLTDDHRLGDGASEDGPETAVLASEQRAIVGRALATLPDRNRRLMTLLADQPGCDYSEISAALAMPLGSIGPTRARSIARLRWHPELRGLRAAGW
jgi:RNA polymerase sigma factor (sigma-70 family)